MDESLPSYGYYDESNISGSSGPTGVGSGPSLLDYLNFGGKTATGILGALNKPKTSGAAPKTNWALIGGIVAAFLGVLLLVAVVSGKGK
jgi:hypothetical protein